MITVSGSFLPFSDIAGEYPENGIERQLLEQMSKGTENYRYDALNQPKFELSTCREIVNVAKQLNSSGMKFAVLHKSECSPDYWERTGNGGFLLKDGVKSSDTIRDIFNNGRKHGTEYATAMVIVYYKVLLEILPEETFNRLFPPTYLTNWHKLGPLPRETGAPKPIADILLGDRRYFINPEIDPGVLELQGEDATTLPGGLYHGYGIGITTVDRIIHILNVNRIEGTTQSAHFTENLAARPDFKKLKKTSQNSSST